MYFTDRNANLLDTSDPFEIEMIRNTFGEFVNI